MMMMMMMMMVIVIELGVLIIGHALVRPAPLCPDLLEGDSVGSELLLGLWRQAVGTAAC